MKKYLKNVYDAGTIAFHYTILYSLYSAPTPWNSCICQILVVQMHPQPPVPLFPTALEMLEKRRRHAAYFYHFYVNGIPKLPVEMLP